VAPREPHHVYRRRRLVVLGMLIAATIAIVVLVNSVAGDPESEPADPLAAVAVDRLVGQRLMVRMKGSATPELERLARDGAIGGVILFPPPGAKPAATLEEVERLQSAATEGGNPPLLVAIDQEGGAVKRLPAGPPQSSPSELGAQGDAPTARAEGERTARYLSRSGVNVDLAPVLDVPQLDSFMLARGFGTDPGTVSRIGVAFAEGLADGGVAATAKHFPGLGRATLDTDITESVVDASREQLEAGLEPFRAAVSAGVALVMTSNAVYPEIDVEAPASLSQPVIEGELREGLGFDGVVITDDLLAGSIQDELSPPQAAVQAALAGADVLLFAKATNPAAIQRRLLSAAESGELSGDSLEQSYARIVALKETVASR
jgi:beta-N-acetylhexosaminidase